MSPLKFYGLVERTTILSGVGQARPHKGNICCSGVYGKRCQDGSAELRVQGYIRLYQALKNGTLFIKKGIPLLSLTEKRRLD
jgi:hypothetical protein